MHQLRAPCAHQSGKAQNLAFVQLEGDVFHAVAAELVHLQHYLRAGSYILHGVILRKGAAHHQLDKALLVGILNVQGVDILAVPQDGDPVADFEQLLQPVGDVNYRHALTLQISDHIEEPPLLLHGDGGGGLVQNQHPGLAENGLADLHNLPVGHGKLPHPGSGGDVALKFLQQLRGLFVPLRLVDEEAAVAAVAHEQVVRHGHGLKLNHLLIHHGDAQLQGLLGRQLGVGDPVKNDLALVGLHRAVDGLDESGFAGPVFAHQGVDFSLPEGNGHLVQSRNAGVAFCDIV